MSHIQYGAPHRRATGCSGVTMTLRLLAVIINCQLTTNALGQYHNSHGTSKASEQRS
jgi:hypothetical protein